MRPALVIHPGALGDVLLAIPALRALRARGDTIALAAQPRIGALLVALGVVDRAIVFDALGLESLFTDAPVAADAPLARRLAEVTRVVCWFGARDPQFVRRLRAAAPCVTIAPATTSPTPPVWRHLLATVGGAVDAAPVSVASAHMADGRRALRAAGWDGGSRVLVVHPGAGGLAKRWPVEGFVEAVGGIDVTLVVHQGPADADAVDAFLEHVPRPALRLVDPPLPTLAGALASAAAYLGNDSGISHLAAAVGCPSLILFTEAAQAWIPWSPTARCLTVTTSTVSAGERAAVSAALTALL